MTNNKGNKHYKIGYVSGSFDMFHIGHLNLIRRAKERCDYLVVGILADECIIKNKKKAPIIPLDDRVEIVEACKYVDEVDVTTEKLLSKVEAWKKYRFDAMFTGDDHKNDGWAWDAPELNKYGAEIVYFPYTQSVSSTKLRSVLKGNGDQNKNKFNDILGLQNNGQRTFKLGIVGTGRIAGRTMPELKVVNGINAFAVYNPNKMSAERFAKSHNLLACHNEYEEFLDSVEAVYVATPHDTHYDYTKRALLAGKHVLCEKPFVLKQTEAEELFELAHNKKLVLMEAIKTAYAPGFLKMMEIAKSGKIGKIYDVESAFTKLVAPGDDVREYSRDVGGSFTELVSYSLLPIIKLLGYEFSQVTFERFDGFNGVDLYAKAYLKFEDGIATAKTGIGVKSEGQLLISGSKGYILAKSPWWLTKEFEVCYENRSNNEHVSVPFQGYGMRYEIAEFVKNISESNMDDYKLTHADSIAIAKVIEKFLHER